MHKRKSHRLAARRAVAAAGYLAALSVPACAQAPAIAQTAFPFVIPWDDAVPGTATDVSWLNDKPAGAGGPIVVRGGHFVEATSGKRVRFLGTNFTFNGNFPTHADAEKVAAHVAKLGINIVRIHHHDVNRSPLWDQTKGDHRHFDADGLDRLDYLIYQFKRNGIYVDLNLHVSRTLTSADGLPASADQIKQQYDKRVDRFDRTMIARQKEFAHDYLTHVNPYTKLAYTADPVVAFIEINNENSLVDDAPTNFAGDLADLPEPFRGELMGLWNDWLTQKYGTDERLRAAWSGRPTPPGPSLVTGSAAWTLEHHDQTAATLTTGVAPGSGNAAPQGAAGVFSVDKVDGTDWHVQAHLAGLDVHEGDSYTVRFQARADKPRKIDVAARLDQADWRNVGLSATADLTPEWKSYAYTFLAEGTVPRHTRLSFVLGGQAGKVEVKDVTFSPGIAPELATAGGTLAAKSVALPLSGSRALRADWVRFLVDTETAYAKEMLAYIKQDLKAKGNVIDTQISWSRSAGLIREAPMDFADNHAYWQHPRFPGRPWDMANWNIANSPQVPSLAKGEGALAGLASYRVDGKPYSISEYNEPAPNDYRCEAVPELAAFAAAQDWDAVFLFDWGNYGAGAANDRIQSFFSTGSDPARAAFLPAAALIFRSPDRGLPPLSGAVRLDLSESAAAESVALPTYWSRAQMSGAVTHPFQPEDMLTERISVRLGAGQDAGSLTPLLVPGSGAASGPAARLTVAGEGDRPVFTATADGPSLTAAATDAARRGAAAAGYLGGRTISLGPASIAFGTFGNGFCAATVTSAGKDGARVLVTLVGKVENHDMGWNAARTSVGTKWGTGPSTAEFIPATVTLSAPAGAKVWALDGSGNRTKEIPATVAGGKLTFKTAPETASLWYEIGM